MAITIYFTLSQKAKERKEQQETRSFWRKSFQIYNEYLSGKPLDIYDFIVKELDLGINLLQYVLYCQWFFCVFNEQVNIMQPWS